MIAVVAKVAVVAVAGTLFTMCEGGPVPRGCCEPGDRLDVAMQPGDWVTRCHDYGGRPVITSDGVRWCQDVDF